MFKSNLISNGGMLLASGIGMVLANLAEQKRQKALMEQQALWDEAVVREKAFLKAHKEFLTYKQMEAMYNPMKREYEKLLRSQTRLAEVAGFFAHLGIEPEHVFNPDGGPIEQIVEWLIEQHKFDQKELALTKPGNRKKSRFDDDDPAYLKKLSPKASLDQVDRLVEIANKQITDTYSPQKGAARANLKARRLLGSMKSIDQIDSSKINSALVSKPESLGTIKAETAAALAAVSNSTSNIRGCVHAELFG